MGEFQDRKWKGKMMELECEEKFKIVAMKYKA